MIRPFLLAAALYAPLLALMKHDLELNRRLLKLAGVKPE